MYIKRKNILDRNTTWNRKKRFPVINSYSKQIESSSKKYLTQKKIKCHFQCTSDYTKFTSIVKELKDTLLGYLFTNPLHTKYINLHYTML